jgi:hypothetical protein
MNRSIVQALNFRCVAHLYVQNTFNKKLCARHEIGFVYSVVKFKR